MAPTPAPNPFFAGNADQQRFFRESEVGFPGSLRIAGKSTG
jgi:hypothetical protein